MILPFLDRIQSWNFLIVYNPQFVDCNSIDLIFAGIEGFNFWAKIRKIVPVFKRLQVFTTEIER
jgi:hypothetical protein